MFARKPNLCVGLLFQKWSLGKVSDQLDTRLNNYGLISRHTSINCVNNCTFMFTRHQPRLFLKALLVDTSFVWRLCLKHRADTQNTILDEFMQSSVDMLIGKCQAVVYKYNKAIRDGKYLAPPHVSDWQRSPHCNRKKLIFFRDVISLLARVFILLIDTATQEVPMKTFEGNCLSSFWDTPLNYYMLNVAHVTNDAKWRPIVTTFGTLIENMSRTGLYDCHIFQIFVDDFMSNINCGIGVLHVKRQILTYFFVTSFLCSLKFALFHLIGHTKRCLQKNIEHFLWLSFWYMTVPSKSKVPSLWPWPLTYEGQCFSVNW